jgi:outer membrane protein assembly factor BamB
MDVESGAVFIDLGLERGEPVGYGSPERATSPTWFGPALLGVLILLCTGASAAPARSPLSTVFSLQVGPADAYALADDGQLLAQTFGTLTSYDLGTGRLRWQNGESTPSYRLRTGDGLVLMRPLAVGSGDPGTTAVSVATGAARWRRAGNVVTVAGSPTLLAVSSVRSVAGAGRRVEGSIDAVDPLTGNTRWTVRVPSTAVLVSVPGPADDGAGTTGAGTTGAGTTGAGTTGARTTGARMLLVRDDRTAVLHDLDTGRELARTSLPPADYGPDNPVVAGGLLLLLHPSPWGAEVSAYDPVSLRQVWTESADGAATIQSCGLLACLTGTAGIRAIDPQTGDERWSRPRWQAIGEQGPMTIAYAAADDTEPVGVIDPDTGRVLVSLVGWRPVGGTGSGDHLLVTRAVDAGARTMVAVARPGDPQPRLLADLPAGTGDCQAVPTRLVCRSMYGELVVWAYHQKG